MKTVLFNPYTGRPRHPLDIQSDPQGLAIVDPEAPLLAAKDDTPPPDLSDAMHASAAAGCGCADCAFDREPCLTCYAAWWRKRHPNIVLAGGEFDNDPLGVLASEPPLPDADVQDESGLLTYYSKDSLEEYAQAWRDACGVLGNVKEGA